MFVPMWAIIAFGIYYFFFRTVEHVPTAKEVADTAYMEDLKAQAAARQYMAVLKAHNSKIGDK